MADAYDLLRQSTSDAKRRALYDTFDIPNVVNYLAISLVLRHSDQGWHNFYVAHQADTTGRISMHPWDLDLTWAFSISACRDDDLIPFEHGQELYAVAQQPKAFAELDGGHNDAFLVSNARYREATASRRAAGSDP